jgi:ABC-type transport system substrate-binding protein
VNRLWIVGVVVAAALLWWTFAQLPGIDRAATPPAETTDRARPQGDGYVVAVPEPATLNPFTSDGSVARRMVLRYALDALLDYDAARRELVPALATSVTTAADGVTHRFTLRDGITFADGSPVTIEDVLFPFEVGRDPEVVLGAFAPVVQLVESARAVDARTLELRLKDRHFAALPRVASGWLVGSKRFFVDAVRAVAVRAGRPPPRGPGDPGFGAALAEVRGCGPGSGPYQPGAEPHPAGWVEGRALTMVRNRTSWRRRVEPTHWNLDWLRLRFDVQPDAIVRLLADQEIDWWYAVDAEDWLERHPELARHYRVCANDLAGLGHYQVIWNCRREPLRDARVRKALGMLFDRERIAREVFRGHATPAVGWFKPGMAEYPDGPPMPFDPVAAAAALREAGAVGDGRELAIEVVVAAGIAEHRRIFAALVEAGARAGVRFTSRNADDKTMALLRRDGAFDAMIVVKSHDLWIDPFDEFHSSQIDGGLNWSRYANERVDDLLARARVEPDAQRRAAAYREFQRILIDEQPVSLLVHPRVKSLFHRRFRDAEPGPMGLYPAAWWVPADERLVR